jgi:predicted nucleotidyltransferase
MNDWRNQHGKVITDFMSFLNMKTDRYVLKGGTALHLCYNLDRFSEDIDLDGRDKGLSALVEEFCAENAYSYRVAKNTDTVERCFVNYGNAQRPLKIEASYRRREIPSEEVDVINGIRVYRIESLCVMKVNAYSGRDKVRDLYDITFISNHYFDKLPSHVISLLRGAVEYKGIEQFDYVVSNQPDELIDSDKLLSDFLEMYDRLGLMYDENERQIITDMTCDDAEASDYAPQEDDDELEPQTRPHSHGRPPVP